MLQFVPVTDELMEQGDLPHHWPLVPYQVDHDCFRWSLCSEWDSEEALSRVKDRPGTRRNGQPRCPTVQDQSRR